MGKTWTDERVTLLRSLWADGVPGGVIARRLGVSRGMVAGKRHSLGLTPRGELAAKAAQAANGRRTAVACGHVRKADALVEAAKAEAVAALENSLQPLPGSSPRPWELRLVGECAFPVAGYGAAALAAGRFRGVSVGGRLRP
jgi:GcrA cell cycle regulator